MYYPFIFELLTNFTRTIVAPITNDKPTNPPKKVLAEKRIMKNKGSATSGIRKHVKNTFGCVKAVLINLNICIIM